ncbi:site-specific DNA-methyltransferase [Limnohabitans sp.]|uniref:site-specific DNA-methyltransferase n=1 Tax=Limnohabitans sp. TaxID=1907725 RepID=UPI00286ECBF8|nr:site-specific DNA-methyltransferase [Limnohabitans sp.]
MPEIVFKGKEYVYNHHLSVPYRSLVADAAKGVGPADLNSSLIIHGDNLHALKALLPRYAGQVDLVFIDPPYNTGNEGWCYSDGVNSPIMKEWLSTNPVDGEDMLRHDKWLCMMWPRLVLLRELLKPEGVLLISLDDNEQHNAIAACLEIFGDGSFLGQFVWKSRQNKDNRNENGLSVDHEYILAFGASMRGVSRDVQQYANPDLDERGAWVSSNMVGLATKENRPNLHYEIVDKNTGNVYPPPRMGWRYGRERMSQIIDENRIIWPSSVTGRPREKVFLSQMSKRTNVSSVIEKEIYTRDGTLELEQILGHRDFAFPKPSELIEYLIEIATNDHALILDSFAGSGTTAHAVLKANAKDNGNRKFILVEGEDYADRLTAERVRRVINGYAWVGTQRETLLEEKINFTQFKKAADWLAKVEVIKAREGFAEGAFVGDLADQGTDVKKRFDKINTELKDGVLRVEGEKKVSQRVAGLGGEFTYCTLGEPLNIEKLLSGEALPTFEALGAWLFHTATGGTLPAIPKNAPEFYLGEAADAHVWLVYAPDVAFLKSPDAALNLSRARALAQWGAAKNEGLEKSKKHLVFAPVKYLSNKQLAEYRMDFCPLPFALLRGV